MGSLRTANTKHNRAVALAVKTTKDAKTAAAAPVRKTVKKATKAA